MSSEFKPVQRPIYPAASNQPPNINADNTFTNGRRVMYTKGLLEEVGGLKLTMQNPQNHPEEDQGSTIEENSSPSARQPPKVPNKPIGLAAFIPEKEVVPQMMEGRKIMYMKGLLAGGIKFGPPPAKSVNSEENVGKSSVEEESPRPSSRSIEQAASLSTSNTDLKRNGSSTGDFKSPNSSNKQIISNESISKSAVPPETPQRTSIPPKNNATEVNLAPLVSVLQPKIAPKPNSQGIGTPQATSKFAAQMPSPTVPPKTTPISQPKTGAIQTPVNPILPKVNATKPSNPQPTTFTNPTAPKPTTAKSSAVTPQNGNSGPTAPRITSVNSPINPSFAVRQPLITTSSPIKPDNLNPITNATPAPAPIITPVIASAENSVESKPAIIFLHKFCYECGLKYGILDKFCLECGNKRG